MRALREAPGSRGVPWIHIRFLEPVRPHEQLSPRGFMKSHGSLVLARVPIDSLEFPLVTYLAGYILFIKNKI